MNLLVDIVFWGCLTALLHTYFFYPLLLLLLARGKQNNTLIYRTDEGLPYISVIMSVYNEEKVIDDKLRSLIAQDYPAAKLAFFIGSDGSDDATDRIVRSWEATAGRVHFFPFARRRGKPQVINELVALALRQHRPAGREHVLLITDANVMLSKQTTRRLAEHFRRESIAIVDANMVHTGMTADGISQAENTYISSEVRLKHCEGIVWRKMIGPFGGCYALRSTFFTPIPENFLVDDFYIAMRAFEKGGDAVSEPEAVCYEAVSHEMREEYRRKARISAGNFQNLRTFHHLWWPVDDALAFAFFSHKVLRWCGPFFLIGLLTANAILAWQSNIFYRTLLFFMLAVLLVAPMVDYLLTALKINVLPLRGIRYFMVMNFALLEGFFKYVKGIKTNVWEPPKRH